MIFLFNLFVMILIVVYVNWENLKDISQSELSKNEKMNQYIFLLGLHFTIILVIWAVLELLVRLI